MELARGAALGYLFFALAFWLFWIPFSAVILERRKAAKVMLGLGALVGLLGGAVLFVPVALNPASLQIVELNHSIHYDYAGFPALQVAPQWLWHLFYLGIIALPLILMENTTVITFSIALVLDTAALRGMINSSTERLGLFTIY